MEEQKLRIGIVGCGGIANQKHLPSIAKLFDYAEIVAFCDIIPERAAKAKEQYGSETSKVYEDYKELLKDSKIDIVNVLTPNKFHCQITVDALEAGKHVMCEKPMAISSIEAQKMLDTAKRTGKKLTIGYQNRFRSDVQFLYKECADRKLGDIYFAKAHAVRRKGVPTWGVFMDKEKQGGGPLIDIGTHALDMTLWMMNNYKPKQVSGSVFQKLKDKPDGNMFGPWNPDEYDVEDSAFGFIKMENGATIFLESAWVLNVVKGKEASCTLCGTKAGAEMYGEAYLGQSDAGIIISSAEHNNLTNTFTVPGGGVAYFDPNATIDEGYLEAKQWFEAVINDTEPLVRPEQALVVTQILEAIYIASTEGRTVEF